MTDEHTRECPWCGTTWTAPVESCPRCYVGPGADPSGGMPCHPYDDPCQLGGPEVHCRSHGGTRNGESLDGKPPTRTSESPEGTSPLHLRACAGSGDPQSTFLAALDAFTSGRVSGLPYECLDCGWVQKPHPVYGWQRHDERAVEVHQTQLCPALSRTPAKENPDD